jgi:signal transduction histidine kinase
MLIFLDVLLLFTGMYIVLTMVEEITLQYMLVFIIISLMLTNLGSYFYFRRRFIGFSNEVCRNTEEILHGRSIKEQQNKETLTSKMIMELEKIEDIFSFQLAESQNEKRELQEMISELTHQIKTPASNIQMYCEMFSDPDISSEEAKQFVMVIKQQLGKLEFLLDVLVKSSRLENDMINLQMENSRLIETLAVAVNSVMQKAEHKRIDISVSCRPAIQVYHDMKWTAEAIENILDNAIKYTPENGKVLISVEVGEMYTVIKIKDTGKGIEAAHINDIFKRFYREKSSSKDEGLGLGLYLARNIINLQGGYVSVHSSLGKGSNFFVCLPNRTPK